MKRLLIAMVLLIVPVNAHAGVIRWTARNVAKGAVAVGKVSIGTVAVGVAKGTKAVGKATWKVIY